MREKNLPRWLLPILTLVFLAAIFAFLFVRRLGGNPALVEGSSSTGAIQPAEINPDRRKPTQPRDPCSLLTPDEVADELAVQIGEPFFDTEDNLFGEMACTFPGTNDDGLPVARLVVVYNEGMEPSILQSGYSVDYLFAGRNVSDRFTKPVADIGDQAFWGGTGSELWNGLHILVWDVYLHIDVNSGDEEKDLQAAQNLARIALNRLFNE